MTIDDIQKLIDQDESVTLELKKGTGELKEYLCRQTVLQSGKYDPSSTPQVPPKYHPSTPQVQLLIDKMKSGYMSTNDIMESCGLKDRKYFRESYIVPGLIDHAIERKYPNEPNHPRQMYRLTKQALEWKKSRED